MRKHAKATKATGNPRGRPRSYEPRVALRQAADAFWKAGYSGTSLDEITAATGMHRPSLRAAFGDKRAIYREALVDYWECTFAPIREALRGELPLRDALMRVYDEALSIYFPGGDRARGCFVVGTAVTEAVDDPDIRRIVVDGFRRLDSAFEMRLRAAQDAGELGKDADPRALAWLASATMHSMAMRARIGASRRELRTFAERAVEVICA